MLRGFRCVMACAVAFAALNAGCGKREPPFSPEDERKTFRLPQGFRAELVASEPDISDVVTIAFDPAGRMFAAEMPEYPLDPQPRGRIKLLEDRDRDGHYEHASVFAEELHFTEGLLPWRKGLLVACAPDLLYFEDADGDGRADIRKVVMTGFGNPQLRFNNPIYGLDNWIYAAHPRPPVPRRFVKEFGNTTTAIRFPEKPGIAPLSVHGMDVRFRPDKFLVERVSGNSQFGHGFDAWGNRFTVWNNDHVRHVVIQNEHVTANPYLAIPSAMQSVSDHEAQAAVFPITENPLVIHDTQAGRFTSACGLSVYVGGNLPQEFENNSFTCEPVHNLVHRDILEPRGATFAAKRAHERSEFLASTDSWFHPVFTTTGPDGALYVVDYYRYTVEHPEFVPPELLKQIDFKAPKRFGRIWRVVHESSKPARKPDLASAASPTLAAELENPNYWWRINAQRLLVERQDGSVVPALQRLVRESPSPYARIHALWTLDGLGSLGNDLAMAALSHQNPGVRVNAVKLSEMRTADSQIKAKLLQMAADSAPRVQFQVACALTRLPRRETLRPLQQIARQHAGDGWFQSAVLASASDHVPAWFRFALDLEGAAREEFVRRVAAIAGSRKHDSETALLLREVATLRAHADAGVRFAALNGLADGLKQGSAGRAKLPATQDVLLRFLDPDQPATARPALRIAGAIDLAPSPKLAKLVRRAAALASSNSAPVESRECAAGILGLDSSGDTALLLIRLLTPAEPQQVQIAAAAALGSLPLGDLAPILLKGWRGATTKVRDVLLAAFFADQRRLPALLDAIKKGVVQTWTLGPARTRQLLQHGDPAIREQARAILGEAEPDRKAVYNKYLPAITMEGRADRGRQVFERACAECHKVGDTGHELGPDLRSVSKRYRETLLADIIMPNQNIEGGYEEYLVETADGRDITGILAKETPTTLTLRRRRGDEDTILRSSIKELRSLSVSPMPEDLEKSISIRDMADLIAFIKGLK